MVDLKKDKTVKDFQKIKMPKQDLTISQNRFKNTEIFDFGGFMDKDIPLYKRVPGLTKIIGLEHEGKLSA